MFYKKFLALFCLFFASYANAAQCQESKCWLGHFGIGGAYYDFGSADISSYGAYISLEGKSVYYQRFQFAMGGRIGGGLTQSSSIPFIESKAPLFIFDAYVKIGANIATKSTPLFVNLVIEADDHNGNIASHNGIDRSLILLGGELEGAMAISPLTQLDYSLGYAWVGSGQYVINDIKSKINNYSDEINASIGFTRNISDNTGFYTRLRGKYQNLQKALYQNVQQFPASHNFVAMLEIGFKGL